MLKLVVLVSGGGTNLQAIIDGIADGSIPNTEIKAVISNNKNAYALQRAKDHNIAAACVSPKDFADRAAFNQALLEKIQSCEPDLIVLAGCLVVIPEIMVDAYPNKIINIHPSLIPAFCGTGYYGLKVHEGVLKRGVKVTGATVHFVDKGTDTGSDHHSEGSGSTAGRYPGNSAAACHGAGRMENHAAGDPPDRRRKSPCGKWQNDNHRIETMSGSQKCEKIRRHCIFKYFIYRKKDAG